MFQHFATGHGVEFSGWRRKNVGPPEHDPVGKSHARKRETRCFEARSADVPALRKGATTSPCGEVEEKAMTRTNFQVGKPGCDCGQEYVAKYPKQLAVIAPP